MLFSRIHFCFVQKSLKLRPGISAEPKSCILNLSKSQHISAHLSCVGPLGLSRIESDWAASSNQSQKESRRRVPPGSWDLDPKNVELQSISVASTCDLPPDTWRIRRENMVKTLISWLASPLAHWDSNCPIETWHKSFLSTLKTCQNVLASNLYIKRRSVGMFNACWFRSDRRKKSRSVLTCFDFPDVSENWKTGKKLHISAIKKHQQKPTKNIKSHVFLGSMSAIQWWDSAAIFPNEPEPLEPLAIEKRFIGCIDRCSWLFNRYFQQIFQQCSTEISIYYIFILYIYIIYI